MRAIRRLILEMVVLLMVGAVVGLGWNGLFAYVLKGTPVHGIRIPRQYFRAQAERSETQKSEAQKKEQPAATKGQPEKPVAVRTKVRVGGPIETPKTAVSKTEKSAGGDQKVTTTPSPPPAPSQDPLQTMKIDEVEMFSQEIKQGVVVLDAREHDLYVDGHIPGAYNMYHFESDNLIDSMRDKLDTADTVIVYCTGGDCEDSMNLGLDLVQKYNVPYKKVYVYKGGIDGWKAAGYEVKTGEEP